MRLAMFVVIASLALSACVSPQANSRKVVATRDFASGNIAWCSHGRHLCNDDNQYQFRWKAIVVDDLIEICGVGRIGNTWMLTPTNKALRNAWVEYQGNRILTDLSFFHNVGSKIDLIGSTAYCQKTGTTASGSKLDVQIKIPATEHKFI